MWLRVFYAIQGQLLHQTKHSAGGGGGRGGVHNLYVSVRDFYLMATNITINQKQKKGYTQLNFPIQFQTVTIQGTVMQEPGTTVGSVTDRDVVAER